VLADGKNSTSLFHKFWPRFGAETFKQSMGARNRVRIVLSYRTARRNWFLKSILGLLKSLKIPGSGAYLLGGGEAASCCRLFSPLQLTMRWGGKDKDLTLD
jgi:hypothetical protein